MNLRRRFNSLSLETQIVFMICGLGSIRTLFAVVIDLVGDTRTGEVLVDATILFVLSLLAYLCWEKSISNISIVFGFAISVLLALNFLQFGGFSGYAKFNYYAGLYIIIMIYSRRELFVTVEFHLILLVTIILIDYLNLPVEQLLFINSTPQVVDFWFTLIVISIFAYHLKRLTDIYSQRLSGLNIDMANRVKEARTLNKLLQEKNNELKLAQQHLEREVSRRSEVFNNKNRSIENFLKVNTSDLVDPIQELVGLIGNVRNESPLSELLRKSATDLETVSGSIREVILSDQPINRKNINPREHTA
ncbi:MAG TPA: hypothetical protein VFW11_01495 [Cyclobacteriaceae bacterium]|nr:hypothetical protein [Cyclobacteriaceae bacterium]